MRCRSAIARGRSGGRSTRTVCRPPPLRNVFLARSTSAPTSEGSGETDSVPVAMRPDQRLQARPRTLLVPVGAGVGDRRRRQRREQHEHLFVLARELPPAFLLGQKEAAHAHVPMTDRRALQSLARQHGRAEAERPDVAGQVSDSQRARKVPEVLEQPLPFAPLRHLPVHVRRDAGAEEPLGPAPLVNGRDRPAVGAGQSAGAVDDLLQHGVEIEAPADPQQSPARPGECAPATPRSVGAARQDASSPAPPRRLWRTLCAAHALNIAEIAPYYPVL